MQKNFLMLLTMLLIVVILTGCNTLERLTGANQTRNGPGPLPDDYTITGTTAFDYETIQPIRTIDSTLVVEVSTPNAGGYVRLNDYEFKVSTSGVGGAVTFGRVEEPTFNQDGQLTYLVIEPYPAAPKGSKYKIRSIRN